MLCPMNDSKTIIVVICYIVVHMSSRKAASSLTACRTVSHFFKSRVYSLTGRALNYFAGGMHYLC